MSFKERNIAIPGIESQEGELLIDGMTINQYFEMFPGRKEILEAADLCIEPEIFTKRLVDTDSKYTSGGLIIDVRHGQSNANKQIHANLTPVLAQLPSSTLSAHKQIDSLPFVPMTELDMLAVHNETIALTRHGYFQALERAVRIFEYLDKLIELRTHKKISKHLNIHIIQGDSVRATTTGTIIKNHLSTLFMKKAFGIEHLTDENFSKAIVGTTRRVNFISTQDHRLVEQDKGVINELYLDPYA